MRIRRRPLPFPPLLTSSPILLSDPSTATTSLLAPKTDFPIEQPIGESAPVKTEQVLHPNGDLLQTNPHASQYSSPPSSTSLSPGQVMLKKKEEGEEKKRGVSIVESTTNARAPVSTTKRVTNGQDKDQEIADCTMIKDVKKDGKTMIVKEKKTRHNSAVLLEGWRCSRVNGRGWQCCQLTLVGYSLCEHHLGKGRMCNMNNATRGQLGYTGNKRNLSGSR